MQCCQEAPRQYCTGKSPVQCGLNTPGAMFQRKKPYAVFSQMLQTNNVQKKNPGNIVRTTLLVYLYTHIYKPKLRII